MKAYTDGQMVYKVGSLGANCWKHIEIHKIENWQEPGHVFWTMTSGQLYKVFGGASWISDEEAEKALMKVAEKMDWKEVA